MEAAYESLTERYRGGRLSVNACELAETEGTVEARFEYVDGHWNTSRTSCRTPPRSPPGRNWRTPGTAPDHLGTYFSGIENYASGGDVRTFGRGGLESIFGRCGAGEWHFYYPYPDYK